MRIGTISQLWRYPVKSMGGERLDPPRCPGAASRRSRLGGPRRDPGRRHQRQARAAAAPPAARATRAEPVSGEASPPAEIPFPTGRRSRPARPTSPRLGALAGRPLSLRALGPAGTEAAPRMTSAGDSPEPCARSWASCRANPSPTYSAFTPERLRLLCQGNFFDAFALHLMTRTTLRTLARLAPESAGTPVVSGRTSSSTRRPRRFPRTGLVGRRLRIGTRCSTWSWAARAA